MADPSKGLDEFFGDLVADLMRGSGKGVKQAGKAHKKGTAYRLKLGIQGTCNGSIDENVANGSRLEARITPGPIVTQVGGEASGGMSRSRTLAAQGDGAWTWFAELEILNAMAMEDGSPEP